MKDIKYTTDKQGLIHVKCPLCNTLQLLPQGQDDYTVHMDQTVWPIFVCSLLGCDFMADVRLVKS